MKELSLTCRKCMTRINLFEVLKGFEISYGSIAVLFHCPVCDKRYRIEAEDKKWLEALGDRAKEFFGFDLIKLRNIWKNMTVKNLKS
ncbi:MAG: hypothetical protein QXG39_08860 [Candidatus Aenigmatarchaeota archaeon]